MFRLLSTEPVSRFQRKAKIGRIENQSLSNQSQPTLGYFRDRLFAMGQSIGMIGSCSRGIELFFEKLFKSIFSRRVPKARRWKGLGLPTSRGGNVLVASPKKNQCLTAILGV